MRSLPPLTRKELERRGPSNVRAILDQPHWSGVGPNSEFNLHTSGVPNPTRAQVEAWLKQKERAANRKVIWTLIFAAIGAIGSIIAAFPVLQGWLR